MKRIELIEHYLDELFPNPKCELNYSKDYELLISVMLSAQTTDKRVNEVTKALWNKYNTLESIKQADINDLKSILRPLGNFNKKAVYTKEICTALVDKYNGIMPRKRKDLESLPGVGRKTTNVVFAELDIEPQIAVDTHVERVSKRLDMAKYEDDVLTIEKRLRKIFKRINWSKRHLQLVLFGRYKCKAISPDCMNCNLKNICRYYKTMAKSPKR